MYRSKHLPPGTDAVAVLESRGDPVIKKLIAGVKRHRKKLQLKEQPEYYDKNVSSVELEAIFKQRQVQAKKDTAVRSYIEHLEKRHR